MQRRIREKVIRIKGCRTQVVTGFFSNGTQLVLNSGDGAGMIGVCVCNGFPAPVFGVFIVFFLDQEVYQLCIFAGGLGLSLAQRDDFIFAPGLLECSDEPFGHGTSEVIVWPNGIQAVLQFVGEFAPVGFFVCVIPNIFQHVITQFVAVGQVYIDRPCQFFE